ncbi:WYL domain-containing protein [Clostridium estertheticum]|uniref:WYL domain-containing protein n=1 Tax=Clostridium estertheticum TaxID=238834 RepID=UPI001CCCEF61|nr:WYL domain-containing protein [Clostridium estertheticum]MBZ9618397.1 WYL domain-containing protein [Clostridium estertheticum subsp. laramiense]MCB2343090.1 WYL domain-containing protein [Clostridium estertheticum]WAG76364.1 WYL domain-containing protein [Clostridium estertheticum]
MKIDRLLGIISVLAKEKGQIIFSVSNLEWATNLVFSLQDKVKVIAPLALKEAVKTRIKRISELYKDDI